MSLKCEGIQLQVWSQSNNSSCRRDCIRMPARCTSLVRRESGMESKGLILLIICGFYAVVLFLIARLGSCMFSKLSSSVKSAKWQLETTEGTFTKLTDDNNNLAPKLKFKRLQPRTISHG